MSSSFKTEERLYDETNADHSRAMAVHSTFTTTNEHLYRLLPLKPWQTRLLRLHKANEEDPVSGDLVVADITHLDGAVLHQIEQQVDYNALSYCWGDGPFSQSILLNDVSVKIKENLFHFLLQYRESSRVDFHLDYIWIDAICIDQANDREKSNQVASMKVFFQHAKQVLVWLGKGNSSTAAAVDFLRQGEVQGENAGHLSILASSSAPRRGLSELYSTPWATRIWVRQEVWSAKDITVLCGQRAVSWEVFSKGFSRIDYTGALDDGVPVNGSSVDHKLQRGSVNVSSGFETLLHLRQPAKERIKLRNLFDTQHSPFVDGNGADILFLLEDARFCESTDMRDRIYALLGMCNDRGIKVDYAATVTEVFVSLASHLIEREDLVATVLALNCSFGTSEDLDLPSWVPDWRRLRTDARDSIWKMAFHSPESFEDHDLESLTFSPSFGEAIVSLPAECRSIKRIVSKQKPRTFCSRVPNTLRLRGFIMSILPKSAKKATEEEIRILWNPLSEIPRILPRRFNIEDKFTTWQHAVRSRALAILNTTPPCTKRKHVLILRQKPKPSGTEEWRMITRLLGFESEQDVPKHIKAQKATPSDVAPLGAGAIQLEPRQEAPPKTKACDVLVVVHGCDSPMVLRQQEDKGKFTFVGIMPISMHPRLSRRIWEDGPNKHWQVFGMCRSMLYAREGMGLNETFEVE